MAADHRTGLPLHAGKGRDMKLDEVGKVDSADILIIGGGIAGLVAANAAKDEAPDVDILVVEKAHVPYGGQANKGAGNINYLAPGDDHEKWIEHHVKKIGIYLEDQDLLRAYETDSYLVCRLLLEKK